MSIGVGTRVVNKRMSQVSAVLKEHTAAGPEGEGTPEGEEAAGENQVVMQVTIQPLEKNPVLNFAHGNQHF